MRTDGGRKISIPICRRGHQTRLVEDPVHRDRATFSCFTRGSFPLASKYLKYPSVNGNSTPYVEIFSLYVCLQEGRSCFLTYLHSRISLQHYNFVAFELLELISSYLLPISSTFSINFQADLGFCQTAPEVEHGTAKWPLARHLHSGPKSITLPDIPGSERFRRDSHPVASDIVPNYIKPRSIGKSI